MVLHFQIFSQMRWQAGAGKGLLKVPDSSCCVWTRSLGSYSQSCLRPSEKSFSLCRQSNPVL